MNRRLWIGAAMAGCCFVLFAHAAPKASTASSKPAPPHPTVGIQAAHALSTITGVAISPLLGVGTIGAWQYFSTDASQRQQLPWFTRPWFWIPALLLVSVCFAKDVMGPAVPTALKKPMDAVELFENKSSGLIAAGAFVPLIVTLIQTTGPDESLLRGMGLAAFDPWTLVHVLTIPFAIVAFLMVWMVSHVIQVLILISPLATVDAGLKAVRLFLLSTVTLTAFADAYVGAGWALGLIVASYFLAGWSFRLTAFGTVFGWDLLTLRYQRFQPKPQSNWMFTARKIDQVPVRTYGKLARNEVGRLVLNYRPLLVLPPQELLLPEGIYAVGRGLFFPELLRLDGETSRTLLFMPPRFRTHEAALTEIYQLAEIRDLAFLKGGKAIWQWLKLLFGFGRKTAVQTA